MSLLGIVRRDPGFGADLLARTEERWRVTTHHPQDGWRPSSALAETRGALLVGHAGAAVAHASASRHGAWLLAHDGALALADGHTDPLFAYLLARIDSHPPSRLRFMIDMVVARSVADLAKICTAVRVAFVLSDGGALYAYGHGVPLFLLEHRNGDQTDAIFVTSEPQTKSWQPIPDGQLIVVWRTPDLGWSVLLERKPSFP